MTTVVDASVAVDLCARRPGAAMLDHRLRGRHLVVPAHFDTEVLNGLRRLQLRDAITTARRDAAIRSLTRFPATRVPLPPLLDVARGLLGPLSGYDALYVACVLWSGATELLTRDRRLASAPGLPIPVTVV